MSNRTHGQSSFGENSTGLRSSSEATGYGIPGYRGSDVAAGLLTRLFQRVPGTWLVRLWNGETLRVGATARSNHGAQDPNFTLVFRGPDAVTSTVLRRDPLSLAESYFRGDLDVEGDFFAALGLKDHLQSLQLSAAQQLLVLFAALKLRAMNADKPQTLPLSTRAGAVKAHSKAENRAAIHFHYDLSNEFYALWLDRAMVYSCAYFQDSAQDLDSAQRAKLDHVCRKLLLKPGESLLDVGCGWGALVIHAAQHYGVRAHGITLSSKQLEFAKQRIAIAGLGDRVTVELKDYRDLEGGALYDKVASIGMFEHVGLKNLPLYFSTVHRLLKPRGLFLNHGITHQAEGWQRNLSTEFINRYVFPDGQLEAVSNVQLAMERANFEIDDVEALRPHYALTLRHWVRRLEQQRVRALQHVSETTYRVWRLYMSACALQFEAGDIGIYQILAGKRAPGNPALPLTRRHLYPDQ
jgi:cyclopropane-fatty-acyl-phospholipid synthase